MSHLESWQRLHERVLDHHKHVSAELLALLTPRFQLFLFHPALHRHWLEYQQETGYQISSIYQASQVMQQLGQENRQLYDQVVLQYPNWAGQGLTNGHTQSHTAHAIPCTHLPAQLVALMNRAKPNADVLQWRSIQALLQSPELKADQSGWSRVPVNLLRSGLRVLQTLADTYGRLWRYKQQLIEELNLDCTHYSQAAVTLLSEHLLVNLVPSFQRRLDQCQTKLTEMARHHQAQQGQWRGHLRQTRLAYMERIWTSQSKLWRGLLRLLHGTIQTMASYHTANGEANGDDGNDEQSTNNMVTSLEQEYREARARYSELDHRIQVQQSSSDWLEQPFAHMSNLMQDWLALVSLLLDLAVRVRDASLGLDWQSLSASTQGESQEDAANQHAIQSSNSNSTLANTNTMGTTVTPNDSRYQQFRLAMAAIRTKQLQEGHHLQRQYIEMRDTYRLLTQGLAWQKQQHAELVLDPEQLQTVLASSAQGAMPNTTTPHQATSQAMKLVTRPDLHHLVQSSHHLDDLEQRAAHLAHDLRSRVIPQLAIYRDLAGDWREAEQWTLALPAITSHLALACSDEARLIQPMSGLDIAFRDASVLQLQLAHMECQHDVFQAQEVHSLGTDHVAQRSWSVVRHTVEQMAMAMSGMAGGMTRSVGVAGGMANSNGAANTVPHQSLQTRIADLFALLGQIQRSLADQPSKLGEMMSQVLLQSQAQFVHYTQSMDAYQDQCLHAALLVASQVMLDSEMALIQMTGREPMVSLLRLYDHHSSFFAKKL